MKINKNIPVQPLLKIKRQYIYSSVEDSEVVLVSERNNAGLKRLSQILSEQTSVSSAFLNAMYSTVNRIFQISIRIIRHPIS
jgi:hypothetical protein